MAIFRESITDQVRKFLTLYLPKISTRARMAESGKAHAWKACSHSGFWVQIPVLAFLVVQASEKFQLRVNNDSDEETSSRETTGRA